MNGCTFEDIKVDNYGSWGKTTGHKTLKDFPHIQVFYAILPNSTENLSSKKGFTIEDIPVLIKFFDENWLKFVKKILDLIA
jgi:hypothetical protein